MQPALFIDADLDLILLKVCRYDRSLYFADGSEKISQTDDVTIDLDPAGVRHEKRVIILAVCIGKTHINPPPRTH